MVKSYVAAVPTQRRGNFAARRVGANFSTHLNFRMTGQAPFDVVISQVEYTVGFLIVRCAHECQHSVGRINKFYIAVLECRGRLSKLDDLPEEAQDRPGIALLCVNSEFLVIWSDR